MGYALNPSDRLQNLAPKSQQEVLEKLSKAHDLITPTLADFISSPDGADASTILLAALTEDKARPDLSITVVATSTYRAESLRVLFHIAISSSGETHTVRNDADTYKPICKGCFGNGIKTPMRTEPLFNKTVGDDGITVWTECPRQERQMLVQALAGSDLDGKVPLALRKAFATISLKFDELRGKGALDDAAKTMGKAQAAIGWDDVGLNIRAHISKRDKLVAVAHLYTLTPYGRTIDCGEGPKLYSSDWEFVQAVGGRQKEPDIDYFRPCWWCRGGGVNEKQPWKFVCEAAFIFKLFGSLLKHRIEKGRWTTSGFEAEL